MMFRKALSAALVLAIAGCAGDDSGPILKDVKSIIFIQRTARNEMGNVFDYTGYVGGGRIVNLGSLAGKEGLTGFAAYSAASAGVISFTKALSREVIEDNIFVNCVAPGPIDTDMIRGLGTDAVAKMIGDSPMKRLGSAAEVAHLVAWLCTDASRFNAGAVFDMSGGRARY